MSTIDHPFLGRFLGNIKSLLNDRLQKTGTKYFSQSKLIKQVFPFKFFPLFRSELYTKAVLEYLENHKDKDVTKTLNMIYTHEDSSLDNELQSMQIKSLPKEDW
jgi:hypothetical protein